MKTIIRRVMTLAIVALVLGGGYFLGSKYLWPAPDARIRGNSNLGLTDCLTA
jgi:hypothetical protein